MNYAIVKEQRVTNIIVGPLPTGVEGVPIDNLDVAIGDSYIDSVFYRESTEVLTDAERAAQAEAALAELLEALNG